jgi:hypothetical protein
MVYKTPHRTLKNEQYEPTKNKQWPKERDNKTNNDLKKQYTENKR